MCLYTGVYIYYCCFENQWILYFRVLLSRCSRCTCASTFIYIYMQILATRNYMYKSFIRIYVKYPSILWRPSALNHAPSLTFYISQPCMNTRYNHIYVKYISATTREIYVCVLVREKERRKKKWGIKIKKKSITWELYTWHEFFSHSVAYIQYF